MRAAGDAMSDVADKLFEAQRAVAVLEEQITSVLFDDRWEALIHDFWCDDYDESIEVLLSEGKTGADVHRDVVDACRDWGFFLLHFSVVDKTCPRERRSLGGSRSFMVQAAKPPHGCEA